MHYRQLHNIANILQNYIIFPKDTYESIIWNKPYFQVVHRNECERYVTEFQYATNWNWNSVGHCWWFADSFFRCKCIYFECINAANEAIITSTKSDSYQFRHQDLFPDRRLAAANGGRHIWHLDKSRWTKGYSVHVRLSDQISRPSRIYLSYLNRRGRIISGFRQCTVRDKQGLLDVRLIN